MQRVSPTLMVAGALVAAGAAVLMAAGPGSPDALIPYQGRLDLNGSGVNGPVDMRVGLFTSGTPGVAACLANATAGCGVWADEFTNVPLNAGAFSLALGSRAALPNSVFTSNDGLWIAFAVRVGTNNYVVLDGLQPLHATPYTVRTEAARDLGVTQNLTVTGAATVGSLQVSGATQLNGLNVAGTATLGTATMGDLTVNNITAGQFTGFAITRAQYQVDALPPFQGGPAFQNYDVTRTRYVVEATKGVTTAGVTSRTVRVDDNRLLALCSDIDGCTVTLSMVNWSNNDNMTFMGPFKFYWGAINGNGDREWRLSGNATAEDGNPSTTATVAGVDGDGALTHIIRDHNCFFTEGAYTVGDSTVTETIPSLYVLNYNIDNYPTASCRLVIED